jgi:hypothetical protein
MVSLPVGDRAQGPEPDAPSEIQSRLAQMLACARYRGLLDLARSQDGKRPVATYGRACLGLPFQAPEALEAVGQSLERRLAMAVAPDRPLSAVLHKIPELYRHLDEAARANAAPVGVGAHEARPQSVRCHHCEDEQPDTVSLPTGVVCKQCGDVLQEHLVMESDHLINYVDKHTGVMDDRKHFGAPLDPHFQRRGLGTMFRGVQGKRRSSGRDADFTVREDGRAGNETRIEYKDDEKAAAFRVFSHHAASLQLHPLVEERAKDLFTVYRDAMSRVQDLPSVLAACLVGAQLEVTLVHQGSDPRVAFQCAACGGCFSERRDLRFHSPCGSSSSSSFPSPSVPPGPPLPPAHAPSRDPRVYRMGEARLRRWLTEVEGGAFAPVAEAVMQSLAAEAGTNPSHAPTELPGMRLW